MEWRQRLARFTANGQEIKAFCLAESMSEATFHRWRKQLAAVGSVAFGQKSEKRHPDPEGVQGILGVGFDAIPDTPLASKKTVVPAHERKAKPVVGDGADESSLFFDDKRVLARCLTGVGLLLWLGGLGCSFLALYLKDDDNEVFLRRSYFRTGHPELGRFKNLDHEVESFGSLSMGTRAEMEWADRLAWMD